MSSLAEACPHWPRESLAPHHCSHYFRHHYADKSGNDWGEPFEKVAGKMYRIDLDYGSVEDVKDAVTPGSLTKLEPGNSHFLSGCII